MSKSVTLTTKRLTLRPPTAPDIPTIVKYANNEAIARYTLNLPFPYAEKDAVFWINMANEGWASGEKCIFSIRDRATDAFMGGVGLHVAKQFSRAELGYWVAEPFWGRGFTTEAVGALIQYGFDMLRLRRIHAHHIAANVASGKVMLKNGMTHEGTLRQHMFRDGVFHDVYCYGMLREEFKSDLPF